MTETLSVHKIVPDPSNMYLLPVGMGMLRQICMIDDEMSMTKVAALPNLKKQMVTITATHTPDGYDTVKIIGQQPQGILLIYIRDTSLEQDGSNYTLSYDRKQKGKDYRALRYTFDKALTELSYSELMGDGLSISDDGLTLNIQSGNGIYESQLPNIFAYEDTIDYADFKNTSWSTSILFYNMTRYVGSKYISGWSKSSDGTKYTEDRDNWTSFPSNRHNYRNSGGNIVSCQFKIKQTLLASGVLYEELRLTATDSKYQLWDNQITYRKIPNGEVLNGANIGKDYISGNHGTTDYQWQLHHNIDIFGENSALYKIVNNTCTSAGSTNQAYQIDLKLTTRYYTELPSVQFYLVTDTWKYNGTTIVEDDSVTRTETLMVGTTLIESLKYVEKRYIQGNANDGASLTWLPGAIPAMTKVSSTGDAHGGYGDGVTAAQGSISGPGIFNATLQTIEYTNPKTGRKNVKWYNVVIGIDNKYSKSGERDLHVEAFDNYNGAAYFIIMYRFSDVSYTMDVQVPNSNDGTTSTTVTTTSQDDSITHNYIAYQIATGGVQKINIGTGDFRHKSCQINNGYMVYTYNLFSNNVFQHRIVGLINITTGTKKEFTLKDTEGPLLTFKHFHAAAIGLL